jgi:hypothetical protein
MNRSSRSGLLSYDHAQRIQRLTTMLRCWTSTSELIGKVHARRRRRGAGGDAAAPLFQLQLPPHGLALAAATVSFAIGAADGDGPSSRL